MRPYIPQRFNAQYELYRQLRKNVNITLEEFGHLLINDQHLNSYQDIQRGLRDIDPSERFEFSRFLKTIYGEPDLTILENAFGRNEKVSTQAVDKHLSPPNCQLSPTMGQAKVISLLVELYSIIKDWGAPMDRPIPALIGPPKSGVTTLVKILAEQLNLPYLILSPHSWMPQGSKVDTPTLAMLSEIRGDHILFIDEMTSCSTHLATTSPWYQYVVREINAYLSVHKPVEYLLIGGTLEGDQAFQGKGHWVESHEQDRKSVHPLLSAHLSQHTFNIEAPTKDELVRVAQRLGIKQQPSSFHDLHTLYLEHVLARGKQEDNRLINLGELLL